MKPSVLKDKPNAVVNSMNLKVIDNNPFIDFSGIDLKMPLPEGASTIF
jgi:hypothetical protein